MKPFISLEEGAPEYRTTDHINEATSEAPRLGLTHYREYRHMTSLRESIAKYYVLRD